MTPAQQKRLISLALVLVIAGAALLLAFGLPPFLAKKSGPSPTTCACALPIHPLANGTTNATQNKTAAQLWDQINLLWGQLNSPNGLWPRMLQMEQTLYFMTLALLAAFILNFVVAGFMVRYLRSQAKALRAERVGPDDPNLYAILEPIIEKVLGPEYADAIDKQAKADVLRRIRTRASERRERPSGIAGRVRDD